MREGQSSKQQSKARERQRAEKVRLRGWESSSCPRSSQARVAVSTLSSHVALGLSPPLHWSWRTRARASQSLARSRAWLLQHEFAIDGRRHGASV